MGQEGEGQIGRKREERGGGGTCSNDRGRGRKKEEKGKRKRIRVAILTFPVTVPSLFLLPWCLSKFLAASPMSLLGEGILHSLGLPASTWMSVVPSQTVAKALSHCGLWALDPYLLHFSAPSHKVFSCPIPLLEKLLRQQGKD